MSVVIEARNLSKRFFLGERNQRAFFEDVAVRASGAWRRLRGQTLGKEGSGRRDFWALRDVSFQISHGDTLAIIGENGAGKSTLLKVLSRITQPTTGTVKVWGRLASLLEVGTGFHPEFSGRDNIFLNGAMLGLSRREVRSRFDRIIDFSELEAFIDVPVKNYSSGMYVRLAFSVAAHLNPEIVILDEVLAVGDAAFQKKCFDRMEEIISEGHAAIVVSHALMQMRRMSQTCMWLEHGRVKMFGSTDEVASAYEKQTTHAVVAQYEHASAGAGPAVRLERWSISGRLAKGSHAVISGHEPVTVRLDAAAAADLPSIRVVISIADLQGLTLLMHEEELGNVEPGPFSLALEMPSLPLRPGQYILSCTVFDRLHTLAVLRATPELTVLEPGGGGARRRGVLVLPTELKLRTAMPVE